MFNKNTGRWLRNIALAFVLTVGMFLTNYGGQALAADNYSAATDTYQETRNPNRVNTTPEELAQSKMDVPEKSEGESIYEQVIDRVDRQRDTSIKGQTATETKSQ